MGKRRHDSDSDDDEYERASKRVQDPILKNHDPLQQDSVIELIVDASWETENKKSNWTNFLNEMTHSFRVNGIRAQVYDVTLNPCDVSLIYGSFDMGLAELLHVIDIKQIDTDFIPDNFLDDRLALIFRNLEVVQLTRRPQQKVYDWLIQLPKLSTIFVNRDFIYDKDEDEDEEEDDEDMLKQTKDLDVRNSMDDMMNALDDI
jgi:hypothetical protein